MGLWSLGVDLGTSYCVGAVASDDGVRVLEVGGESRVPSTVLLDESGRLLAGTFAQRSLSLGPERGERNPKRYVGRRSPMLLGGRSVTAADALAEQLRLFADEGRRYFDGADPAALVLTHPAAWTHAQLGVLEDVADRVLPGVPCRLLPEPVAAALYYATDRALAPGEAVGVYDLGGGTFDVAVLRATGDGFTVLGTDGDPDIGGENFDNLVHAHFGRTLSAAAPEWWDEVVRGTDRRSLSQAALLQEEARKAKETLSQYPDSPHYVASVDVTVSIERAEFEDMIRDDIERTGRLLADVIAASGAGGELSGIFLTGGASRIPLVADTLRPVYGDLVRTWQNPKAAVALGAAHDARRSVGAPAAVPDRPAGSSLSAAPTAPADDRGPEPVTRSATRTVRNPAPTTGEPPAPAAAVPGPPAAGLGAGLGVLGAGVLLGLLGLLVKITILYYLGVLVLIVGIVLLVRAGLARRSGGVGSAPVSPTPPEPR